MSILIRTFLALMILLAVPSITTGECLLQRHLVTVTADGEIKVVPDEITFLFGVETWDKDLYLAKSENDHRIKTVLNIAQKYGIKDKDIQTDFISIEPRYEHQWERKNFIGYFVKRNVAVTLRNIARFDDFLSNVLQIGANYFYGVQFNTSELEKYKTQARILAMKSARTKAVTLARVAGQRVGKPYQILESQIGFLPPSPRVELMRDKGVQPAAVSSEPGTSIALGQIKITATVTVSFDLGSP